MVRSNSIIARSFFGYRKGITQVSKECLYLREVNVKDQYTTAQVPPTRETIKIGTSVTPRLDDHSIQTFSRMLSGRCKTRNWSGCPSDVDFLWYLDFRFRQRNGVPL